MPAVEKEEEAEWVLSRSRRSSGQGQTVIIVEDDGRESTSREPIRTTNPPPPFLFHLSSPSSAGISRPVRGSPRSLWVTSPPFSKPFFKCVGVDTVRNQTKGHSLRTDPDPSPEKATGRLPSDSTSLLRFSSSKKSWQLVVRFAEKNTRHANHLRVGYPCRFMQLAEVRLLRPWLTLLSLRRIGLSENGYSPGYISN